MRLFSLCVTMAACFACTMGSEQRQESRATIWRQVASWSGRGATTLETFPIAAGRLRLHWTTANESSPGGGRLKVRLHSADSGRVLEEPVDVQGVSAGSKDIVDDHQRFYLSVESTNVDWSIRVEEGLARRP